MTDTSSDNVCNSKNHLFTTRYTYGSRDQEYVFSCRGRPFAALVSPHFPTPTSSLFDYDLIKSLGLKLTDLQCKKFCFAGNKFRILGRVSTTVQCIQNGRSGSNFHMKGLVISDLNKVLDTHCVAGHKMQQLISSLSDKAKDPSDDDWDDLDHDQYHHDDNKGGVFNERKCETQTKNKSVKRKSESYAKNYAKKPGIGIALDDSGDDVSHLHHDTSDTESDGHYDRASFWVNTIKSRHSELPPDLRKSGHGYTPDSVRTQLPPGTCPRPSALYALDHSDNMDYSYWSKQALTQAEAEVLKKSSIDGKPRVINVNVDKGRDDMLRVGVWNKLGDPSDYQRRHILIASLRRAAPGRVCQVCHYMLRHTCPLSKLTGLPHCATCCDGVNSKKK